MKLLNQSLKYLTFSILIILTIWSVIFYFNMLHEIKSSIDEGLENSKRLIIKNALTDPSILNKKQFDESYFSIQKITKSEALTKTDTYTDTTLLMQDADDDAPEEEPVRMLTTAFRNNDNYYELKVANSILEEDDLIKELLWDVVWLCLILILSILIINNWILKKLWNPFYDFLQQLRKYRIGNANKLPNIQTNTKEFIDLNLAVNALLKQNTEIYENQKEFIGNASHELQTPLAIVTNKIELFLEDENLDSEQAKNITEIYQIIHRLIRLNKSLLLLSKIDNNQYFDNKKVSINTTVYKIKEELHEFISNKNIQITITETTELFIEIDPILITVLIGNLFKNAIFHNIENGKINIEIDTDRFSISNSTNKPALDQKVIFNRFHKSKTNSGGTGLGLAIVKAITKLYEYQVKYEFGSEMHSFQLFFSKNNSTNK